MLAFKKDNVTLFGLDHSKILDIHRYETGLDDITSYMVTIYCTKDTYYTIKFKKVEEAIDFMDNLILCCNFVHANYIVDIGNGEI